MSSAAPVPEDTTQLVLVLTDSWDAHRATLFRFERTQSGWRRAGRPVDAVLGSNGLAWGRGLHEKARSGLEKKEGDRRAPAGMFRLLPAMGYERTPPKGVTYPYSPIEKGTHCVDDANSRYYNRIVRESDLPAPATSLWTSSEVMRRKDDLYKWLIVVDHNGDPPTPGAGSCIFLHVWRAKDKGTAGCTALAEGDLVELMTWLKSTAHPVLVQLPAGTYQEVRQAWNLPDAGAPQE